MQTLVIIPVGRETVDKILVVSLLVLYNQGSSKREVGQTNKISFSVLTKSKWVWGT